MESRPGCGCVSTRGCWGRGSSVLVSQPQAGSLSFSSLALTVLHHPLLPTSLMLTPFSLGGAGLWGTLWPWLEGVGQRQA